MAKVVVLDCSLPVGSQEAIRPMTAEEELQRARDATEWGRIQDVRQADETAQRTAEAAVMARTATDPALAELVRAIAPRILRGP